MSNATVAMGILVLIIGIFGMIGWLYSYNQISGYLSIMQTAEGLLDAGSLIPVLGNVVGAISDSISGIRTTITLFFISNIIVNLALIFSGIGFISIGRSTSHSHSRIDKLKNYLMKSK